MKKNILMINAEHEGYGIEQIQKTLTVGELIAYLEDFDENTEIYLKHDGGYTYGGITYNRFEDAVFDEETEELE